MCEGSCELQVWEGRLGLDCDCRLSVWFFKSLGDKSSLRSHCMIEVCLRHIDLVPGWRCLGKPKKGRSISARQDIIEVGRWQREWRGEDTHNSRHLTTCVRQSVQRYGKLDVVGKKIIC